MIPRRLIQVWVGGRPAPEQFLDWRAEWKAMHPEWEHVLIDDVEAAAMPLRNRALYDEAETLAGRFAGQLRADILRYEALLAHGGVYADLDCEPIRPLDPLLDVECFVGWEETNRWLNNAVMGATAGHEFVEALVAGLDRSVRSQPGARPAAMSGPRYLTPLWLQRGAGVTVYPKAYFYPYLHNELHRGSEEFPDSYVVHHWNNARTNTARVKARRRGTAGAMKGHRR